MFRKPLSHNKFPKGEKGKKKYFKKATNPKLNQKHCLLSVLKQNSNKVAKDWIKQLTATITVCEFSPKSENCQVLLLVDNYQLSTQNTHLYPADRNPVSLPRFKKRSSEKKEKNQKTPQPMHIHPEPNYGVSKNHMSQKRAELTKTQKRP